MAQNNARVRKLNTWNLHHHQEWQPFSCGELLAVPWGEVEDMHHQVCHGGRSHSTSLANLLKEYDHQSQSNRRRNVDQGWDDIPMFP